MSQSENSRKHYLKNKEQRRAEIKARKLAAKIWYQDYKASQKCKVCGESCWACLDFHHRDPNIKLTNVANMWNAGFSIPNIIKEIAKCDVLCSNCHRKLTLLGNWC